MPTIPKELFQTIQRIQIETSHLAEELLAGAWHSAFKGKGMEFEEVRAYTPGDDIRDIDWNVTARMNTPYIKRFREERELTVMLVVDVSASCRFGSTGETKGERIAEIGAAIAFSAIKNNDRVGLILFTDHVEKYIPPRKGLRHVLRVIRELLAFEPKGKSTNISQALHTLGNTQPKKAICFLLTDALCIPKTKEIAVIARKHDLISLVVTDPYEKQFPKMGWVALTDLETGESRTVNTSDAKMREAFQATSNERLEAHRKQMQKVGAGFLSISLDEPYIPALQKFFRMRRIKH